MKQKTKICKNCKYYELSMNGDRCYYWNARIGALVKTYGCDKYEEK